MAETEFEIQKELLKKLDAFTESLIDVQDYQQNVKRAKKRKTGSASQGGSDICQLQGKDESKVRIKKNKKKRKIQNCEEKKDSAKPVKSKKKCLSGDRWHLEKLKSDLGILETEIDNSNNKGMVQEHGESTVHKVNQNMCDSNGRKTPEVIVFENHKAKSKKYLTKKSRRNAANDQQDETKFDMKQARYEVQKLGIKGLDEGQREEATTALLLKLGAKPPKNKYFNYREYQDMAKMKKERATEKREIDRALGFKVTNRNKGRNKPRDRNDIGIVDGQVGKYKSGIQFVKKRDLKGFDKKKKK